MTSSGWLDEVTAPVGSHGGYFFFVSRAKRTRLIRSMIISQNCISSPYVIIPSPPPCGEGRSIPPSPFTGWLFEHQLEKVMPPLWVTLVLSIQNIRPIDKKNPRIRGFLCFGRCNRISKMRNIQHPSSHPSRSRRGGAGNLPPCPALTRGGFHGIIKT